jgi:bifunctional non-homologous end joining protein LigD
MLRMRAPAAARVEPCLHSPAIKPPVGAGWIHEIKHDGYRLMARRDGAGVRLITRRGHDWTPRFPAIMEAVNALAVRSCLIDGEAIACDDNGLSVFHRLRRREAAILCAFDLIELDGQDLRREPIERRTGMLARLFRCNGAGIVVNEHFGRPAKSSTGRPVRSVVSQQAARITVHLRPAARMAQDQESLMPSAFAVFKLMVSSI